MRHRRTVNVTEPIERASIVVYFLAPHPGRGILTIFYPGAAHLASLDAFNVRPPHPGRKSAKRCMPTALFKIDTTMFKMDLAFE
jgi:hypothetical protein